MTRSTFYHQLAVYLLARDPNLHHGAVASAVAFIHDMSETTPDARTRIDARMEQWFGEYVYSAVRQEFASTDKCSATAVLSSLDGVIGELHLIGHDIVQGSAALKSMNQLGQRVPSAAVEAIARHIASTGSAPPGMFHGYSRKEIRDLEASFDEYHPDSTPRDIADSLVGTLRQIRRSYFGFHFLAQETHLFTHAEAMIALHKLGHPDLFRKALRGWFLRLRLLEAIFDPDVDEKLESPRACEWDPREPAFWSAYASYELNIHPIKTMFSYLSLRQDGLFSEEDARFLEEEKLPFLSDSRKLG